MSNFRTALLSTAAIVAAVAVTPASAGEVEKSMSASGHINRVVVVSDNGENTTIGQQDSGVSESRFRINGAAKSESMTIKTSMELGVTANHNVATDNATDATRIRIRHSYVSVGSDMGTLSVGHTWTADFLSTSNSLSGTGNAGFYDGHTIGNEALRVSNDTGTAASGVSVGGILGNYASYRTNTVKYATPNMGGFSAQVGYANQNRGSASLRYSGDFDGTKVIGTVAWGSQASDTVDARIGGSVAVKLAGGLNASFAYSKDDLATAAGRKDPSMLGASLGYTMGANGITAWYQQNEDGSANGDEAKAYALVVEHKMAAYGASVYGGIENVSYDTASTTTTYDDLTAGWVGIKVAF